MNEFKVLNGYEVKDEEARQMLNYSTSETLTGQSWIDGKPIYRKVINFGAAFDNANDLSKAVAHGILLYDTIIRFDGFYKPAANLKNTMRFPIINNGVSLKDENYTTNNFQCSIDPTYITITRALTGSLQTSSNAYFIVEYTKQDVEAQ